MNDLLNILLLSITILSCSTPYVLINRNGESNAALYRIENLNKPIKEFKKTNIKIDREEIVGKALRIYRQPNKSAYFIFLDSKAKNTRIDIDTNNEGFFGKEVTTKVDGNRSYDIVIRSYQAIVEGRFAEARELTQSLVLLNPNISAPHILDGIAWFQEGNIPKSIASYQTALALDPANAELRDIIQELRKRDN